MPIPSQLGAEQLLDIKIELVASGYAAYTRPFYYVAELFAAVGFF
jgi:hypothetical protein